jgi:hypothetical protein
MIVLIDWVIENRLLCLRSRNFMGSCLSEVVRIPFESTFIYCRDIVPTFE